MNVKRQEIFNQDIKIEPSRITITPLDRQLVEKAIQIVEDNISETEFSVEELASSLNISRSYFYKFRKLHIPWGITPPRYSPNILKKSSTSAHPNL